MPTLMTPQATAIAIERKLKENTGKTLEDWLALLKRSGPSDEKSCARWLKQEHGLGHFQAQLVARHAFGRGWMREYQDQGQLLDKLYTGKKRALLPLHERVIGWARGLADDVHVSICKTYVSAYRSRQFVLLRPRAAGLEVQVALAAAPEDRRFTELPASTSRQRMTHRLVVTELSEVNPLLRRILARAYEGA